MFATLRVNLANPERPITGEEGPLDVELYLQSDSPVNDYGVDPKKGKSSSAGFEWLTVALSHFDLYPKKADMRWSDAKDYYNS